MCMVSQRGDVVCIYMPMVLELPMAALACARIGAIHSIVFGGFSAESLAARILDCKASLVVTVDGVFRGPKLLNLKSIVDAALEKTHQHGYEVSTVVLYERLVSTIHTTGRGFCFCGRKKKRFIFFD